MGWDLFWTLFLVAANGFFVAAEFAIVKVRTSQLDLKVKTGSKVAAAAQHITKNLEGYLAATQLGITLSSLALGWVGQAVMTNMVTDVFAWFQVELYNGMARVIGVVLAFALIISLHILFGELVPKSVAAHRPISTTLFVALPLRVFYAIFKPFIWLLNRLAVVILRLFGIQADPRGYFHSNDELRYLLDQGKESGALNLGEHELIQKVFDFNERMVKNIMIPRNKIAAVEVDCPSEELLAKITSDGYSRVPIYEEDIDQIIGIIHTKDILPILTRGETLSVSSIMRKPYFVPETKMIKELLAELQQNRIQIAVVLDEFGGTAGIVTLEDIVEELVGEIQDEYDEEAPIVEKISSTEFIVDAGANVHDVNQFLPFELPEGADYDTISGLVGDLFDKIPDVGEHRKVAGYNLMIMKKSEQNIASVKLEILPESASGEGGSN